MGNVETVPLRLIVLTAFIFESLLVGAALALAAFAGRPLQIRPSADAFLLGAAAALPLLLSNLTLLAWSRRYNFWRTLQQFTDEVVYPFCAELTLPYALLVALLAGIGEELFFRGALNTTFIEAFGLYGGTIHSSVIFAFCHFLGRSWRYFSVFVLYSLFGIYFSLITMLSMNLFPAIVCHVIYDFLAITWLRRHGRAKMQDERFPASC